ncbi:MAG TPA: phenylacetate--CoA ligase family protein [Planctomycetota bacterium]|nr:phenylacetate--CoA ligase family protein [Phycisphaerae bacterium]HUW30468.1 phenylacetate--CoA ligase family protein [Planctomycetota bacterium]
MFVPLARTFFRIQERLLGRRTFSILRELRESERRPREELDALRLERLRQIVARAYEHTPYWRSVMDERGIKPEDIQSLDGLGRFPLLVKATIRERLEEMTWYGDGKRVQLVRTSGSTNEALQFYTSSTREAHINAARMRGHEWVGIRRGDREMYFWGSPVELNRQDRFKRLRDWLVNDGLTNGFEVTPERVAEYVDYWKRWRPKCIFGYPNSFVLTVMMAKQQGIDLSELRNSGLEVICTTSEMLGELNRKTITEAFGVPVYDSYGLREAGLIGHECSHFTMHCMDEQVILETISPETGQPTDGEGELVVTNIVGVAMPLIRYRTGDIVTLSKEPCPCGRTLSSIRISGGRIADFVVTNQGKWVIGYSFIYICRSVKGIVKFQVVQDCIGEVKVLLVTDWSFPADGVGQITKAVRARLGSDDNIVVELVDDIRPLPSGKYRPVIGKVADELRRRGRFTLDS